MEERLGASVTRERFSAFLLAAVALYLPARRASRLHPAAALRCE